MRKGLAFLLLIFLIGSTPQPAPGQEVELLPPPQPLPGAEEEPLPPPHILLGPPQLLPSVPLTGLVLDTPEECKRWPIFRYWSGNVEFGINGTDGNSQLHRLRTAAKVQRKQPNRIFTSDILYTYANANGKDTENRALSNTRWELRRPQVAWSVFSLLTMEYDDFRAFDVRLAVHLGVGYHWWENQKFKLKTRAGSGGSREFGGPDDEFIPEAIFGSDIEIQITERQKLCGTVDLFPDLTTFRELRAISKVTYDFLIDPRWNLSLRLGILDRYDSTPEGKRPNDIEYFGTLAWKF